MVKYCFAGEPCKPPPVTCRLLEKLTLPDHALCSINIRGKNILHVQGWPSWLNKGYRSHIALFNSMFYTVDDTQLKSSQCRLCNLPIASNIWEHCLFACPNLHSIDESATWHAFVDLLRMGHQGLAIYTCFPLSCNHKDRMFDLVLGSTTYHTC